VAIKGKGRTRGRRVVAAPPRPQLVVRKPPIWRRRWVQILVGGLAAAGILTAVLLSMHSNNVKKLKDREAAAVATVGAQFVAQFPADHQIGQENLFFFYTTLSDAIDKLEKGQLSTKDADAVAKTVLDSATKAATAIGKIKVESLIPTSFNVSRVATASGKGITRAELLEARFLMQQAFGLYGSMTAILKAGVEAKDAKQKALIDDLKQIGNQASQLFNQGWQIVAGIQTRLGIQSPAA
jgi:hypothetical protein